MGGIVVNEYIERAVGMVEDRKDRPLHPAETIQDGKNQMVVIGIDIDGCALEHPEKVNKLFLKKNTFIFLHTSRPEFMRDITIKELSKSDIMYNSLVMDKPKASYYIDDKNSDFDLEYFGFKE